MSPKRSQSSKEVKMDYYLSKPGAGKGRPVLVLHAWWGLNPFIKGFCDRLAKEGFVVLAPDLYHGEVAATIQEAEQLSSRLNQAEVEKQLAQSVEQLQSLAGPSTKGIGVVGFSLGGYWGMWLTKERPDAVAATVVFYATRPDDYSGSQAAFQFHLAETDPYEPPSEVEAIQARLKEAGKPAEFFTYPGTTHWFFESDRADAYRAESAELAWRRALDFLKAHLPDM